MGTPFRDLLFGFLRRSGERPQELKVRASFRLPAYLAGIANCPENQIPP